MKNLLIDCRMREIEKQKLIELGFYLIEINKNINLYNEISSHVDIFACKINNNLIVEPSIYEKLDCIKENINIKLIKGIDFVTEKYPDDIKYNVAILGKTAIHNFKYTDNKILEYIDKENISKIDVKQGYTKCSIAIILDNAIITQDKGIYEALKDNKEIDMLYIENKLDIKLLDGNSISQKNGFIGGIISKIDDYIFISGDLNKIDKDGKIRNFIKKYNLNIIDFPGYDIIDYGGMIEI